MILIEINGLGLERAKEIRKKIFEVSDFKQLQVKIGGSAAIDREGKKHPYLVILSDENIVNLLALKRALVALHIDMWSGSFRFTHEKSAAEIAKSGKS